MRRLLSRENIYTLKLLRRGHVIPKALHANMFLVRAREGRDGHLVVLAPADMSFDEFLAHPDNAGRMRHVVVTENNRLLGVVRINTSLRQASGRQTDDGNSRVTMRDIASRNFTIVREQDLVFGVIRRIWRRHATMAVVVVDTGTVPRPDSVLGVITKEHVADSVAASVKVYPGGESTGRGSVASRQRPRRGAQHYQPLDRKSAQQHARGGHVIQRVGVQQRVREQEDRSHTQYPASRHAEGAPLHQQQAVKVVAEDDQRRQRAHDAGSRARSGS